MFHQKNSADFDIDGNNAVRTSYIIASSPRTGSTLLADILWNSARAGAPHEYLHDKHCRDYQQRWGWTSVEDYAARLLDKRTSGNGVFGMKVHYHQLDNLGLDFYALQDLFRDPKYIFVYRKDKLRQAVSFVKAMQTRQWEIQSGESVFAGQYDYRQILDAVRRMVDEENSWKAYFRRHGIQPLSIAYEQLTGNINQTLGDVFDFLGLPFDARDAVALPGRKMANSDTDVWVKRFFLEHEKSRASRV